MTCCENPKPPLRKGLCNTCYQRRWQKKHYFPRKPHPWILSHPERYMWLQARRRAKAIGVPFSIRVEDIIIPEVCPVLGIPLGARGDNRDTAPSLDRRDVHLGYVPGNVFVISQRANRIKSDATLEELQRITAYAETEG